MARAPSYSREALPLASLARLGPEQLVDTGTGGYSWWERGVGQSMCDVASVPGLCMTFLHVVLKDVDL